MSLDVEQLDAARKRYKKIREKIAAIPGDYPIDMNHYGQVLLYGVEIDLKTPTEKIIEIDALYQKLRREITEILAKNNLEMKDDYFQYELMSGGFQFLGTWVNLYEGIKPLMPTINDFILMNHRAQAITAKQGVTLDERFFFPYRYPEYHFKWNFYGESVRAETSDTVLEMILTNFLQFNQHINHLLKMANYPHDNQLQPLGYPEGLDSRHYWLPEEKRSAFLQLINSDLSQTEKAQKYCQECIFNLFTKKITTQTPDVQILEIINAAQLLESRAQQITEELAIPALCVVEYQKDRVELKFAQGSRNVTLNSPYDEIKDMIQKYKKYDLERNWGDDDKVR